MIKVTKFLTISKSKFNLSNKSLFAFVFLASLFNLLICLFALKVALLNKPLTAPENCKYSLVLLWEPEVNTDGLSDF